MAVGTKKPRRSGASLRKAFVNDWLALDRKRTYDFDFDAAIRLQASDPLRTIADFTLGRRIRALLDWIGHARTFGVDTVRFG